MKTTVWPGFLIKSTTLIKYSGDIWKTSLGCDFWFRTKENLTNIERHKNLLGSLDPELAMKPQAIQLKALASIKREVNGRSWWALSGDITLANSGVGKDYSIMLQYGVDL